MKKQTKNLENFFDIVKLQLQNKIPFIIIKKRSNRKIIVDDKIICDFKIQKNNRFTPSQRRTYIYLCGHIKKAYNHYAIINDNNIVVPEKLFYKSYKNRAVYNSLPDNSKFYIVDIKHCYWRIAYMFGIISQRVYERYGNNSDHKDPRNMALTSCLSPVTKEYNFFSNDNPELNNKTLSITEDIEIYHRIYDKIRIHAYNITGEIAFNILGIENFIMYNVDGIAVLENKVDLVMSELNKRNFITSVLECTKVDDINFIKGADEIKKF